MPRVEVKQKIDILEVDDNSVSDVQLTVNSHWQCEEYVVLGIGGKEYTVNASALLMACENATNTGV